MSLAEKLQGLQDKKKRKNTVEIWLEQQTEEDRDLVTSYLLNDSISTLSILAVLKEEGAPFGKDSLHAYRRDLRKQNVAK